MAAPRTTHLKRQKERARQERAQEKAQRRLEKKQQPTDDAPAAPRGPIKIEYDEFGQPIPLDFHDFE